jgi:hypothetical protein
VNTGIVQNSTVFEDRPGAYTGDLAEDALSHVHTPPLKASPCEQIDP